MPAGMLKSYSDIHRSTEYFSHRISRLHRIFALLLALNAACAVAADVASDAPVARIGKQTIPYSQLQTQIQNKLAKRQAQHAAQLLQVNLAYQRSQQAFIESELGKLLDNRVLELEAAAHKTTVAALTSAIKTQPVTEAQERALYESRKAHISQSFEQAEPKIRQVLETEALEKSHRKYFDFLRAKYDASITIEPFREQVDAAGPQRGSPEAPVTIVEFSDFQCPYCGRFTPVLTQVLAAYPTQVRLVYRYLPLSTLHPDAEKAAEAAVCANNQGKFWEMHDTLFAEQSGLAVAALKEKAKRLGLDIQQFDACLDSEQGSPPVAADVKAAELLGLESTPASFVNGRFINGAVSFEELSTLINDELKRAPPTAQR
jgi:protein-disulfide isomerase